MYKEWENILSLLLNEDSFEALAEEIFRRSAVQTNSSLGITVFTDESFNRQFGLEQADYMIYDPEGLADTENAVNCLRSELDGLLKYFRVNRKPFYSSHSHIESPAAALHRLLNCRHLAVVPSIFNSSVLSVSVFSRNEDYSQHDLSALEQLSLLLGFAAGNALTKKLNTTLENQLQQSQKLETIGKLTSGMAHDFNNLLSSIFGSLNLLKKKLRDRDDIFYLLENIENCSVRAADMTKGLLSYGKPTPRRKTVIKPAALLKEITGVIEQTFPDNIKLIKKYHDSLSDIMGNSTEIYQVLLNLCINAKEAINAEGQITLEAAEFHLDEKNAGDFPLLSPGSYVKFSVTDTGEGISEENIRRIFDPYFSTKQKETGGGLGLYVTYGIIKAHNGHIDVASKPGKGTRFDVYIPAYETKKALPQTKTEKIILLADDEIMLRDILAELLESYNYQVVCVENGREALQVLTEEIKADLLIIDYKMPEMDGLSCIKEVRMRGIDVPVILSTGSTSHKEDEEFSRINVECVLTKPYEFEQMLTEVQKLI